MQPQPWRIIINQNNLGIMATLNSFKLIFIILLLTNMTSTVSITTFPQLVESGSIGFFGFLSANSNYGSATLIITFASDKGVSSFDTVFSIQNLDLDMYVRQLSIRVVLAGQTSSSVSVLIDSHVPNTLHQIYVRYLVVIPPLTGSVSLHYLTKDYGAPVLLNGDTFFQILAKRISVQANETKSAVFLMGFFIANQNSGRNFIDLYCKQTITDTILRVNVTTVDTDHQIYLSHISLAVVLINKKITINSIVSTFEVDNFLENYSSGSNEIKQTNLNTVYDNMTSFFGIRAFKNLYSNSALIYRFSISTTQIRLISSLGQTDSNKFTIDIINFVFLPSCTASTPYMLVSNSTCYSTCPSSFFANTTTSTCDKCSSSCPTCSLSDTYCASCFDTFYLFLGKCLNCPSECLLCTSTNSCTSCADAFYLSSGTCLNCPSECLLCTSYTSCTSCAQKYILSNNICIVDCSSLPKCTICSLSNAQPFCTTCSVNYKAVGGVCVSVCGDGAVVPGEQCDDNNTDNNDGCSSLCTEEQHFTCISVNGLKSVCSLTDISLQYGYTVKVSGSNAFIAHFTVKPSISALQKINWINGLTFPNQNIYPISCIYDSSTGRLTITASYSTDITQSVNLNINYAYMNSTMVAGLPIIAFTQELTTENNLALQYYPASVYGLAAFLKYFASFLSCVGLLMLIIGYLGGKLIVLEHIAVLQVAYLCLETVHNASPTFQALRPLRFSAGNTMFAQNDFSANMNRELKSSYYSFNLFETYNVAFALVLLPILIAIVIKALSISVLKSNQLLSRVWPLMLGDMTFYGLIFTSYTIFSQLCFLLISIASGVGAVYMGLAFVICQSLLLSIYCFYLNKQQMYFGDFKKKFQKFNICSYFYTFIVLQRFLTSIFIMLLRNTSFGLAVAIIPITIQLVFVAVRKPYICGDDTRPIINLCFTILIISSVLISNILPSFSAIQVYVPIGICIMLTITLGSNTYYLVMEFKETFCSGEEAAALGKEEGKGVGQTGISIDKIFKFEETESIEQKNRVQFEIFKQKIMNEGEDINLISNAKTLPVNQEETLQKEILRYEWDNYAIVSANAPILQQMKQKVKAKRIVQL